MNIPYWRYVDYTDDGCAHYQCLQCGGGWEARTAPGWFDNFETLDEPSMLDREGVFCTHSPGPNGEKVPHWYRERDKPIYKPTWKYCPICGCEWRGPIQCDHDNERMLGPRRAKIHRMVTERRRKDGWGLNKEPRWFWTLMKREVRAERDNEWEAELTFDPLQSGALEMWRELQDVRKARDQQSADSPFDVKYEAKIITCKADDPKLKHCYKSQTYRREDHA